MHPFTVLAGLAAALPAFGLPAAQSTTTNTTLETRASGSSWFLPNLDHTSGAVRGYVPDLYHNNDHSNPDYTYPVYEAVASGDAQGFVTALYNNGDAGDGSRFNMWLAAQPRVIYLAPGTYELSSTAYLDTDTVIIGDAANPPTIKAAANFNGDYLIVGGEGGVTDSGGESHFSVMIKNVILDTTANSGRSDFTALSWRVAQNSALVNVQINLPQGAHTGIYMGQGSTISVADVSFSYGNVGFHYAGHQQAQLKNLRFSKTTTGILIDGGNTIAIVAPRCDTVGRCIELNSGDPWISIIDAVSVQSGDFFTSNFGYPSFLLENISKDTTNSNMVTISGNVKLGGITSVGNYVYGNTYGTNPVYQSSPNNKQLSRSSRLAPNGKYYIGSPPQYADKTVNDVVNIKDSNQNGGFTVHGDSNSDDTAGLQGALNHAAQNGKIAYIPYGIYRVTSTITIPSGSQIYGEAWSTISGDGNAFSDERNPTAVVQVGAPGSTGTAVMQDMRFTVSNQLPGAIILQVNMYGANPGDVEIHNSLITVGGTRSTSLSCYSESSCRGAYVGLHLTENSSASINNFWSWVADHPSDDSGLGIRVAAKGGVLIESTKGTWLSGVGSEHWWLFNAHYHNAQDVYLGFYQAETNYFQASRSVITPPAPFTPVNDDPDFSWCNDGNNECPMTIAEYFTGSSDIWHYAAGSWNFFGGGQENMYVIGDRVGGTAALYGFTDHNTTYVMRLPDGKQFGNGGNDGFGGSWGSLVASIVSQS